jgi:hypothetical protein
MMTLPKSAARQSGIMPAGSGKNGHETDWSYLLNSAAKLLGVF